MTREYNGMEGNEEKSYKRMTNYSHFSGGPLCCSASLPLEDETHINVCWLVFASVLRGGGGCNTYCMAYIHIEFDPRMVVFLVTP